MGNPVFATLRETGCRTVHTRTLTSTTVITYAYDAANRLDYLYEDGVLSDLDWDANPLRCAARTPPPRWARGLRGKLLSDGVRTFTYGCAASLKLFGGGESEDET